MTDDSEPDDAMPAGSETARTYTVAGVAVRSRPLPAALHLVATPIGNLGDITLRALETIAGADILAAEDTRVTRKLLDRYGIARRATPYHEHNAAQAGPRLVAALQAGRSVALVSDAGTPLVSDPGFLLVRSARDAGIPVVAIPGASSVLTALSVAGMPTESFHFAGFLPHRQGQRKARLSELAAVPATLVLFESPNRVAAALLDIAEILGPERRVAVARELTKAHEQVREGPAGELAAAYAAEDHPRGEIVLVIAPPDARQPAPEAGDVDALLLALAAEMPASRAAAEVARMTGLAKSDLFRRLVAMKER